ncbi:MAG: hypothetical protein V3R83_02970 [Gammaproteobacteria bacterium]
MRESLASEFFGGCDDAAGSSASIDAEVLIHPAHRKNAMGTMVRITLV